GLNPGSDVEFSAQRRDSARIVELRALVIRRGGRIRRIPVLDLARESRYLGLECRARSESPLVGHAPRENAVLFAVVGVADLLERAEGRERGVGRVEEEIVRELLIRSEEHTSELQSRSDLVCRLLLEKKKTTRENRGGQITKRGNRQSITGR